MILAPLRGVTIRDFRRVFAAQIREAGFSEAVTPFIAANRGADPLKDRELRRDGTPEPPGLLLTPQFIGKDPAALRECLKRILDAGFVTADLNCGCPFPMVRKKGRGSGLLRTPDVLERMLEAGCDAMGPGRFSAKVRLGIEDPRELLALIPVFNRYPLRHLTVHARTARQMYSGECDLAAFAEIEEAAAMPIVRNGDLSLDEARGLEAQAAESGVAPRRGGTMVGRGFVRALGMRDDSPALFTAWLEAAEEALAGPRQAVGRAKELLAYWSTLPRWRRVWPAARLAASPAELKAVLPPSNH